VTLGLPRTDFHVPAPKQPQKLPEILSREEVWRLLETCPHTWHRLLLATTYAAGLRVSEVVALKVSDLDADRMTLRVQQGKGMKDRYVPLAKRLLHDFRVYWKTTPPGLWLFPNRPRTRPIDITVADPAIVCSTWPAVRPGRCTPRGCWGRSRAASCRGSCGSEARS